MVPPRVFISYSHDSPEHKEEVFRLSERLRKDGVDAWIDQYELDPDIGWPSWIRRQLERADKVLLVFNETYKRRFIGYEEMGIGLGATFEGVIVTQGLYDNGPTNSKFRVVVLKGSDAQFITTELRRFTWYCVDSNQNYEKLLRWLKGSPAIIPSPIGIGPDLVPAATPELTRLEPIEVVEVARVEKPGPNVATDPAPLQRGKKYEVIFLRTFGGYQTISYEVNNIDQVVGEGQLTGGAQSHPFLYRNRQLIDLNPGPGLSGGRATAINDDGQVVGFTNDRGSTFAFTWRDGHIINIGELIGVPSASVGSGINSSGTIVGHSWSTDGKFFPFIYRRGRLERLTSIQSYQTGISAINDREQIVGFFSLAPRLYRAFSYDSGKFSDLGKFLGDQSQALKINNRGQIVGFQTVSNGIPRAFLLDGDKLIDLGVAGRSMAESINDAGEVVGQDMKGNESPFAFLWTPQDGLLNLNACVENLSDGTSPGFTEIFDAKDINERGNIAASGNYFDGHKTIRAACLLMRI